MVAVEERERLTTAEARDLLTRGWGLHAELSEIGSYEDQNFEVRAADRRYVLKVTAPGHARELLAVEHAVLLYLTAKDFEYAVPVPVPTLAGADLLDTPEHAARLLSWVPGLPMSELGNLDEPLLRQLGAVAAQIGSALSGAVPPEPNPASKWDPRRAPEVVAAIVADPSGPTKGQRAVLERAITPLRTIDPSIVQNLPRQLIHCDVTDYNVLATAGPDEPPRVSGLIDFGDVTDTWRVCDLAVACVAVAGRGADALGSILSVVGGYHANAPLTPSEADVLWPLILARAAACAALSVRQLRLRPADRYVTTMHDGDWAALGALLALPSDLPSAAIRASCGLSPLADDDLHSLLAATTPVPVVDNFNPRTIDLSVESEALRDGCWQDPGQLAALIRAEGATVGRWGEVRLTLAGTPDSAPPQSLHLGADVFCDVGTQVRAPLAATVAATREHDVILTLEADLRVKRYVRLGGIEPSVGPSDRLRAGATVGRVANRSDGGPPHVHVQFLTAVDQDPVGAPQFRAAWLALCPDPSSLIGTASAAPPSRELARERARRARVVADAQELYYQAPMEIARGWRQYLYDTNARPYLDVINNIASVGHSHPKIAAAATRQFRLLNTNSRFLYESMHEYAERLTELLPPALNRIFLVNSGSEACDLALQLARAYTGHFGVIALAGAYHGWTASVYETCTSPADNPGWRQTKPSYVYIAEQPDAYRGRFGADAIAYAGSVADACRRAAGNGGIAAFICEALLGNQGAVIPPAGYLARAYATVREAGGVCIADEIQVGYGRTGASFWAFEHEGVIPDIVTLAKAAGNGHPIGAVACRGEIADALSRRAAFFSSTGGGPVSCQVGIAVLDVLRDEGLQDNAARVGAYLRSRLEDLQARHELIGAVHGRGLYLGIDLVRDRTERTPAPYEAAALCERMLDLGVIVQPTGDARNVLKVKPPLCIGRDDADRFVEALDRALHEHESSRVPVGHSAGPGTAS